MIHNDWKCQITRNSEKNCFKFFQTSANFLRLLLNLEKKSKVIFGFSTVGSALRFAKAVCEAKFCKSHSFLKFPGTLPNFWRTLANPGKIKQSINRFSMKNTTYILAFRVLSTHSPKDILPENKVGYTAIRCVLARTGSSFGKKRHFCMVSTRV